MVVRQYSVYSDKVHSRKQNDYSLVMVFFIRVVHRHKRALSDQTMLATRYQLIELAKGFQKSIGSGMFRENSRPVGAFACGARFGRFACLNLTFPRVVHGGTSAACDAARAAQAHQLRPQHAGG